MLWCLLACMGIAWLAGFHTLLGQEANVLVRNPSLEEDADSNQWPDGWVKPTPGVTWESEDGNHFLRLTSTTPGKMVMHYQEIPIPVDVEAIELNWRQRVSGVVVGQNPWFDARIMMEFMDGNRAIVKPGPKVPYARENTNGWEEKSIQFLVPEGATMLKFMPCLFNVEEGTLDLDDIVIRPVDATAVKKDAAAGASSKSQTMVERQAAAAQYLKANGNLIAGGNYEAMEAKANVVEEDGNHFLRLKSSEPGKMVMDYREWPLPAGAEALQLTWRQRVTGLQKGIKPWFDARILLSFKDTVGKKLTQPSPPYTQKDTQGWVERSTSFLVPEGATTLVIMPALFQVKAGTYDLDDFVLKPTDPDPLLAEAKAREEAAKARYVAPEKPDKTKWPKEIHVEGNKLVDSSGEAVWLQGVNVGGLETLPHDKQVIKSVIVAIDDWKANCVRVPVKEEFWYGTSHYQNDGGKDYREAIDQIITLTANRGAYAVIDLHRFRAPKPIHATFWKDFAAKYKNPPAVLFDLFNEPHDISWDVWRDGGWVGEQGKGVDESAFLSESEKKAAEGFESIGMQALVDAVRSTGAKNIVIAGGLFWCNDLTGIVNGYALKDKTGNGIMYSWHTYHWHPGWERVIPVVEKFPIFLGEVGADTKIMDFVPEEAQEDPYTFIPDMLGFIQKYKINWTGWCLHPHAAPRLILDWTYKPTPFWGVFAKRALAGEQFELKKVR